MNHQFEETNTGNDGSVGSVCLSAVDLITEMVKFVRFQLIEFFHISLNYLHWDYE